MRHVHAKCEQSLAVLSHCWDSPMLRVVRPTTLKTWAIISPCQSTLTAPLEMEQTSLYPCVTV